MRGWGKARKMKYIILFLMEVFVAVPCGFFWIYVIDRYVNKYIRKNKMNKGEYDITMTGEGWEDDEAD